MTEKQKKAAIKKLVKEMLKDSHDAMLKQIDKAINSGAVDIEKWDENVSKMVLPKCILVAIIEQESTQYYGRNTGIEKQIKKEIRNIRYFL